MITLLCRILFKLIIQNSELSWTDFVINHTIEKKRLPIAGHTGFIPQETTQILNNGHHFTSSYVIKRVTRLFFDL